MSLRDERGEFTLVGLLVAMSLFLVVLSATLSLFSTSEQINRDTQQRNDAMDRARVAVDTLSRQLRNMATPTPEQPQSIDRATGTDVVFQTVDQSGPNAGSNTANVQRVRYCLDSGGTLWNLRQTWTSAAPPAAPVDGGTQTAAGSCPGTAWGTYKRAVAEAITNYAGGKTRPVFSFNTTAPLTAIQEVHVDLWLDLDATRRPAETLLSSGAFLRNQNRVPTAAFTFTRTGTVQGVILNGSTSTDPEGDSLVYCWYDTALGTTASPPSSCPSGPFLATGVTYQYPLAVGASRNIYLIVKDPTGLSGQSATTTVTN